MGVEGAGRANARRVSVAGPGAMGGPWRTVAGRDRACRLVRPRLGGTNHGQELVDLDPETAALARERPCRGENHLRGRAGLARAPVDVGDVGRDQRGALRGLLDVVRYLLRGRALLLDRCRDGGRDLRDAVDGAADLLDRGNRLP